MANEAAQKTTVEIVSFNEQREAITHIRTQVFIVEQGIPESLEWDEHEHSSWHAIAFLNDVPVATGRLQLNGKITRIAVLKPYRRKQIATNVLTRLMSLAQDQKLPPLFLNAQTSAAALYEKHGFVRSGEAFDEGGIEHIRMRQQ